MSELFLIKHYIMALVIGLVFIVCYYLPDLWRDWRGK